MPTPIASHLRSRAPSLRAGLRFGLATALVLLGCRSLQNAVADGDTRTITMHHIHTKEDITVTFKRNGRYDEAALKKLNRFLRDWRHDTETRMDPRLIDLLWEVYREVDASQPIQVIGGYRDESTNAMLRRRSNGVAENSLHMNGKAMDFAIPDVPLEKLRVAGLRLQRGGVGFYPSSGSPFVHMDVGGVRHWPRMTREQLARVFPNGRTVHIPTDGQPLAGYALALADIERQGSSPSQMSIAAANDAGIDTETTGAVQPPRRSLLASIFGPNEDETEESKTQALPAPVRVATAPAAPVPLPKMRPASAPIVVAMALPPPQQTAEAQKAAAVPPPQPSKAKAAALAASAQSPNEIIHSRGYWVGLPNMNPPSATVVAQTDPDITASITREWPPTPADAGQRSERLAYAPQPQHHLAAPYAPRRTVVMKSTEPATSIAIKSGGPAPVPVHPYNPWLDAVTITPSVWTYLSSTQYGVRDFRSLQPFLDKPAATVVMAFSADPHSGLSAERFSGHAVMFVGTATFAATADERLTRTASLY